MTQTAGQIQNQKKAGPKAAFPRKAAGWFSWDRLGSGNWPRFTKILLLLALMVLPMLTLQSMRLGHEVLQRLEGLSTAATDNMQWVLSQAEVDHLKLEAALTSAEEPGGVAALRRQFDVYYSRIATFVEGPLFADLRSSPEGGELLGRLQDRLTSLTALIDVPDEQLMKNRHLIAMHLCNRRSNTRPR
ncbi:hypothetical protein [Pseudophaeobacter arcticus]|uniref:hypothetical protein n=1 Tax=Pseudophaeobacter arcticus TaxID=385492 RepID=UPI0024900B8B|nr:hypothetical protein [Pseudophaeobacter arcticus]